MSSSDLEGSGDADEGRGGGAVAATDGSAFIGDAVVTCGSRALGVGSPTVRFVSDGRVVEIGGRVECIISVRFFVEKDRTKKGRK